MAQEGSEASVASSSPTPNWWEIHTNPISSWNAMNRSWHQPHQSNSSCEEDISMNATSNHSGGLSMDSSSADLSGEPAENHLWSQVLFSVGSGGGGGDLHNHHDDRENFLEVLSSKSLATEMFDPACDYLKKLDSSWEFTNPSLLHGLEKQYSSYNGTMIEPERLTNLSDLVSNWSIAPPNPTCNAALNPSNIAHYSPPNLSQIKHELPNSAPSYLGNGMVEPYVHEIKGESQHHGYMGALDPSTLSRPFTSGDMRYQMGLNNSVVGLNNRYYNGMTDTPWSGSRNLSDLISFGSCLNKPAVDFRSSRPLVRGSESSESRKQGYETSSSTKVSGRGSGTTSEGKKKRSEDSSEALFKKSKHEGSNASPIKLQAPKVKLGDRITALQQIVSPFGKTDTASVLLEAINYIRFLQEQVQLLSDPYMKSSANKDNSSWGGLERKDKMEPKLDLRSRGLCLVPISCTPQVYRENNGPDYWTPPYRGYPYR